ncbi:hypothetical protein H6P81_009421 [Aristolochia fimbriata]|uniref:tRNA-specific 2-thiouridylase MnmA-like C-terminal domain-containing protein n=1 Tax=Aristolochia fimbriata TaxID=158543 RepID=A0AAV7ENI6_ARIFI|nr:hypothetical protein H6P81_009421 [Aristolochia fimbriata]
MFSVYKKYIKKALDVMKIPGPRYAMQSLDQKAMVNKLHISTKQEETNYRCNQNIFRYVVAKDIQHNVVFVSRNYFSLDKKRRTFQVGSLKWLSGAPPDQLDQLQCKVRHGPGFYDCSVKIEPGASRHEDRAVVHISEDDQGLAVGQYAAFYRMKTCLGSGVILDSLDERSFPICAKALDIAKMEDKTKLGQPVKIYTQVNAASAKKRKETLQAPFASSFMNWLKKFRGTLRMF